ncbi:MAG TPA: hypothetical protein VKD72_39980 [Gemmataceae bacterium]|nr:hypothetical protein [Gemmataceae bacterium]
MFFPGSRYEKMEPYTVKGPDGRLVVVTRIPLPVGRPLAGYHQRREGQRLDHLAAHYLNDPTGFWKLCDANGAMVPDALAARERIGIPRKEA